MTYGLGVDLGTTFVAAAIARPSGVEMFPLGDHSVAAPSVVLLRQDGTVLTGSAADRRAALEPDRVAREFKRRLGDPVPLIVGGSPQSAHALMAQLLRACVAQVTTTEGGPPAVVTLTHPANWGLYKREQFDQVPQLAGLHDVRTITEPEAAAAHYASTERLPDGAVVAVYDLGGGTFDATVLRKTGDTFTILGEPKGMEGLGGIDFDEAIFSHLRESLDDDVKPDRASLTRLRQDCVLAKEALSIDTDTAIPVLLPGVQTQFRLTRGEFEDMIRPALNDTILTLQEALRSASVSPEQLTAVLLVGGSSRIPLVAKMVSTELRCRVAVDAHPKHAIALGAAMNSVPAQATARIPQVHREPPPPAYVPPVPQQGQAASSFSGPRYDLPPPPGAYPPMQGMPPRPPFQENRGPFPPPDPHHDSRYGSGAPPPSLAGPQQVKRRLPVIVISLVTVLVVGAGIYLGMKYLYPGATSATSATPATSAAPAPTPGPTPEAHFGDTVATIGVGNSPGRIAVAPDGAHAYATNFDSGTVSVIDIPTNTVTATIPVGQQPAVVAISPDGADLYVTTQADNALAVIETASNTVATTIPVGQQPSGVAVSPDGGHVYVANQGSRTVSVIDTAEKAVSATVRSDGAPAAVAVSPDGAKAYVTAFGPNGRTGSVEVLDTVENSVTATVAVGAMPGAVAVTPDGAHVFVSNYGSDNVSVIDTTGETVSGTVPTGRKPAYVAIAPDGGHAYVVNQDGGTLSVIDTASSAVTGTVTVRDRLPNGIAITPDGDHIYVANTGSNSVSVINTKAE